MEWTSIGRVSELIEGVLKETNGGEKRFKLRITLQSLIIIEEQHEFVEIVLADCDMDELTRARLQKLGYLERH